MIGSGSSNQLPDSEIIMANQSRKMNPDFFETVHGSNADQI